MEQLEEKLKNIGSEQIEDKTRAMTMNNELEAMQGEVLARDIQTTNLMEKNRQLTHECDQMQQRLMEEKMKLMDSWNEMFRTLEMPCKQCGARLNGADVVFGTSGGSGEAQLGDSSRPNEERK